MEKSKAEVKQSVQAWVHEEKNKAKLQVQIAEQALEGGLHVT